MTAKHYRDAQKSANRAHYTRSAIATGVLLLLLGAFISAGIWQLGRAGEKQDMKARFSAGSIVKPSLELVSDQDAAAARFVIFKLTGRYDAERQILLDNMTAQGQNGYQVLTPFITQNQTVLVNRGWLKANPDRNQLPDITVSDAPRTIKARLNSLPVPGIRLEAPVDDTDSWPKRLLFPTREQISAALGYPVADYQLMLDPKSADGYLRNWKAVEIGPEKNFGYAFQWFAFAILALVIYIILNLRWKKQLEKQLEKRTA